MYCPNGCYRHSPGLRLRTLPELSGPPYAVAGMVYRPHLPALFAIGQPAWTVLGLCQNLSRKAILQQMVQGQDEASRKELEELVDEALEELMDCELIVLEQGEDGLDRETCQESR